MPPTDWSARHAAAPIAAALLLWHKAFRRTAIRGQLPGRERLSSPRYVLDGYGGSPHVAHCAACVAEQRVRDMSSTSRLGSTVAPRAMPPALQIGFDSAIMRAGNDFDCAPAILTCLLRTESCYAGRRLREATDGPWGATRATHTDFGGAGSKRWRQTPNERLHCSAPARHRCRNNFPALPSR